MCSIAIYTTAIHSEPARIVLLLMLGYAIINALVRLAMCLLAILATIRALADTALFEEDQTAIREHRLAVLQSILAVLRTGTDLRKSHRESLGPQQ